MVTNSDLVQAIMNSLLTISGRKTTKGYAITVLDSIVSNLQKKYELFHHVQLKDTRFLEDDNAVAVMSEIDNMSSEEIGKALHEMIIRMNKQLGEKAGHFFMKELSRKVGSDYYSVMKNDLGLDLNLLQLEHEVAELEKRVLHQE